MAAPRIDAFCGSLTRNGEAACGSLAQVLRGEDCVTVLIADGNIPAPAAGAESARQAPRGSSAAAAARAALAAGMLSSLLRAGQSPEEAALALSRVQPPDGPFTAFAVAQMRAGGSLLAAQYRMAPPVFLLRGRLREPELRETENGVQSVSLSAREADTAALLCGAPGRELPDIPDGFSRKAAAAFLQGAYKPHVEAERLGALLLRAGETLCGEKPDDDFSVALLRFLRPRAKSGPVLQEPAGENEQ